MFTLTELPLKFPKNLCMLSDTLKTEIPKFQRLWIKTTITFDTTQYCEDWVINTVFKVSKHLFLKSVPRPLLLVFACVVTSVEDYFSIFESVSVILVENSFEIPVSVLNLS